MEGTRHKSHVTSKNAVTIAGRKIANFTRPFLVAEIGINHNGSMTLARKMISEAKKSGADAVKFQFFRDGKLINPYIKESDAITNILRKYSLTPEQLTGLKAYADRAGIVFFATVFDTGGVGILRKLKVPCFKIASGDINNPMLIEKAARTGKPVIFSTGMATLREIDAAVKLVRRMKAKPVILHCVSRYPTPPEDANLWSIPFLNGLYGIPSGFSDHTMGIQAMEDASLLGAAIIEKHFTLDRKMAGPDQKLSATPAEFRRFAARLKRIQKTAGKFGNKVSGEEKAIMYWSRRGFVAAREIPKGKKVTPAMIEALRPAKGIPASEYHDLLKKKAKRDIKKGQSLRRKDLS